MRLISWDIDTGQFRRHGIHLSQLPLSRSRSLRRSSSAASSLALLPEVVLLGSSDGLVRALSLPEASRGHDAKRCGDGVRLRSAMRS